MKKYHVLFTLVLLVIVLYSGCTEKSNIITISIESFSPYEASGYVTVDGIHRQNYTLSLFNKTSFIVEKSMLSVQDVHNVSIVLYPLEDASQISTVFCAQTKTKVSFTISVQHKVNIRSCE